MTTEELLRQLVSIPSVSGQEKEIQKWIFEFLTKLGLKPIHVGPNVAVKIPGTNNKSAIVFDAHVDTVPAGDLKAWKYPPFEGKIVGDRIFGLGSSDCKSGVAMQLELAKEYIKNKPACDVWLAFVIKEELDGSGTKEFVEWFAKKEQGKYKTIAAILSEPADPSKITLAHKGNIFLKVTTYGDSGHGSQPEKIKKHAVLKMFEVARILEKLGKDWGKRYKDPLIGTPSIALLTSISAGAVESPNKFPHSCVATFDIRTTPKLHTKAMTLIKEALSKEVKLDLVCPVAPFGYTSPAEKIVKIVAKLSGAGFNVSSGSTDQCFFTNANIPAIIYGPGFEPCCHCANEYCDLKNIAKFIEMYKKVVEIYDKDD